MAVSEGLWDNGAACGRYYKLRCLSGFKKPCKDSTIKVKVLDFCNKTSCPSTMVLSIYAFKALSRNPKIKINIEYSQ
ncbi:eg45-like domain containing protein 2 [Phtheirospermum japonicum]|uniref:Eg45-like domain containing protein 2 n=1 Tax=Phtheirospermum japonicum TaxID=374723 RepID=A0A830D6W1_9LAMI|nr:eg45-like domain containing protein 2 [Phtheirospermum japonicum]